MFTPGPTPACLKARYYQDVALWLWPFLFWQLWRLEGWLRANGRAVRGYIDLDTGRVHIVQLSFDPGEVAPQAGMSRRRLTRGVSQDVLSGPRDRGSACAATPRLTDLSRGPPAAHIC